MTTDSTDSQDTRAAIGGAVADAADTIRTAAADAADRLPEIASATRSALVEVDRQVAAGSDEMLTVGTALSFGMATGLLLAGANRALVLSAFLPAVVLGLRLLDRSSRSRLPTPAASAGAATNGRARLQGR